MEGPGGGGGGAVRGSYHPPVPRGVDRVLTSGEGVHQSWVRVGGVSSLLFGLANLGVAFSKLQSNRLRHVGVKPYALLQNCPQKE